tara:strand:- start:1215 stop:1631 length:417 start_codon:yes stop_codon:yes gene_type:complete
MDNYKAVLNRLYKTEGVELKSEKVELGLADDIQKRLSDAKAKTAKMESLLKEVKDSYSTIEELEKKVKKVFVSAEKEAQKANSFYNKTEAFLAKAETKAKDLGVPTSAIKGFDDLENANLDVFEVATDIVRFVDSNAV